MGINMTPVVIIEGKYLVMNTTVNNLRPILYNALSQKFSDSAS